MMQFFRHMLKYAAGVFILLMLAFVLTSVDWSGFGLGVKSVGKINGRDIDQRSYETMVQARLDELQRTSPASLTLDDRAQIRNDVWEQLIQNVAMETQYKRRGITASEDEVAQALRTSPPPELLQAPEFQTDSQFDLAKYQRWLTSPASAQIVEMLAAQYREQIRRSKLFREVASDVYLSDPALWERFRDEHETVKIGLTAIVPRNAVPDSAITVTPAKVAAYYKDHRKEFERPASAFLSYIALPRRTNAADSAAALARATALRDEVVKGAPFEEVARRESADTVSGSKGGDLGEWTKGSFDPAFEKAAWALPLNAISEPVLTPFGYHIIQISSRSADKAKGRHILVPIELSGAHRDEVDAKADTLERVGAERADPAALDTAARALNLPIGRVGPIQQGTRVQLGTQVVPDASIWAFERDPGETSSVIETNDAYYVFRLDSLQAAGTPDLAAIRPAVEDAVRDAEKKAAGRKIAEEYLAKIAGKQPMEPAAKEMGLPYRELGPFARVNPPLANPVVVGAAFGLDAGERSGVLDTPEGLYVIQVIEKTKADSATFAKEIDAQRGQAIRLARQERVRNYIGYLRTSAEVKDRRAEVERALREAAEAAPPPQQGSLQ